jgi:hypothetical protein
MINEHDKTKSMLDTMRSIRLIKESVDTETTMEPTENMGVSNTEQTPAPKEILIVKNGEEQPVEGSISGFWKADKESFMQTVSSDVSITSFSITPKEGASEGDVKMTGILNAYDIGFSMNKNVSLGLVITTAPEGSQSSDVKLDDDVMKTLNSLQKYYQNWYKDWSTKLNTENFTNVRNA